MCGILGISGFVGNEHEARLLAIKLSRRLRHRGPDQSGIHITVWFFLIKSNAQMEHLIFYVMKDYKLSI